MVQIYRAARWPKVPCFRQATSKDNQVEGNKNNTVSFDHTHNYSHTHEVMQFQIKSTAAGKITQLFNSTPDANNTSHWDQPILYNGTLNGSADGNNLQIVYTGAMPLTTFYTSGVAGSSVNGFLNLAETSKVTGGASLNIEPQNITTIFIIRIK